MSVDNYTLFTTIPPEFCYVLNHVGEYRVWFLISKKKFICKNMLTMLDNDLKKSYFIDG